ncbi:hypothetical protein U1Q18_045049, partial [Sarracenia purpurea var. burkii]
TLGAAVHEGTLELRSNSFSSDSFSSIAFTGIKNKIKSYFFIDSGEIHGRTLENFSVQLKAREKETDLRFFNSSESGSRNEEPGFSERRKLICDFFIGFLWAIFRCGRTWFTKLKKRISELRGISSSLHLFFSVIF